MAVAEICNAGDKIELEAAMQSAIRSLGFDSFNLGCGKSAEREFMTDPTLTSWAYGDLVAYERDGWADRDPLLSYAARGLNPLYWTQETWKSQRKLDYLEYIRSSGLVSGVTVPLSRKRGAVSALTLLSWSDQSHSGDVKHAASIIGMVAEQRAAAIGLTTGQSSPKAENFKALTQLQREILKWMAAGKSNPEISIILGTSKRAVDYHAIEIFKKLEVSSRTQAVAIFASI